MKDNKSKQIINAYEASEIIGIPLSSLYYLSNTGKVKAIKIGRRWRYKKEDIEHYASFGTVNRNRKIVGGSKKRERRAYPRIKCDIRCQFSLDLQQQNMNNLEGSVRNISASGLFLDTSQLEDKVYNANNDDPVKVRFKLDIPYQDNNDEGIKIFGRVVRKDDSGVGIKYRNMPVIIKEKIKRYVG